MLNPIWLKTFVTLVDTGHFTQAAEKLFMTQPGVSQHINKLEKACGHLLITRGKKSFVITEQGRLVYRYAKSLERNEEALIEQLAFDDPYSGECTLACSGSVALMLYPKLLEEQVKHPNIIIKMKAAPYHQILSDIKKGTVDQGIVTDIPNKIYFETKVLGEEELCLVVPSRVDTNVNKATLLMNLGLILHPDAKHYLSLFIAKNYKTELGQLNINSLPVVGFINQINQILEPIANGIGFTVLPKSAVDSFHNKQGLQVIKPDNTVIETLYLVTQKNRVLPARFETLNKVIDSAWK
ncbi:LysR family transcriptional regulator [Alteromonas sp. a30]|uniref:LysR family transcriptional regulator n=1 Tax=Alteromonas sp. a30 TaxID=2730917 RepID=UPI00227F3170|nr:LysR family transcriptional regulator [Alteromonas sp. a30]MCY7296862.1 LysR family transcriptional regulator [Alteromonas sp. a30]